MSLPCPEIHAHLATLSQKRLICNWHDAGCGVETDPTKSRRSEASERKKVAPLRPPLKKVDKVLAAFTFILTSDLMPKQLAAFRNHEMRIELMEARRRKVEYAG
jgi:hypothetical protein